MAPTGMAAVSLRSVSPPSTADLLHDGVGEEGHGDKGDDERRPDEEVRGIGAGEGAAAEEVQRNQWVRGPPLAQDVGR